jgi:hypothetical protein
MRLAKPVSLNPGSLTLACSLKIKAVCIGIVTLLKYSKVINKRKKEEDKRENDFS